MSTEQIKVLLVEDNPGDARLIQEMLAEDRPASFEIVRAGRLAEALDRQANEEVDVVLLDLNLPDSLGLHTFTQAYQAAPQVPIVVLTGTADEELALRTLQMGAQDYLVKGGVDGNLLARAVRYAVERMRLLTELEASRQREQEVHERRVLEQLTQLPSTRVTAEMFGLRPLRESAADVFAGLVKRYGELLELALEQRAYRVEHDIGEELHTLAEQLGFLKAGPRDVVELHATALGQKCDGIPSQKAQVYVEEGRLMVLQLMGYLVSYYRAHAVGRP